MTVIIDRSISSVLPEFTVIALRMDVFVMENREIAALVRQHEKQLREEYSLSDILNIPLIKEARDGYKTLGKDPSRYRLAVESLFRRIVKGRGLALINNVVDAGNILSLQTKRSVAVLDRKEIKGDVLIRKGTSADDFIGIGRGILNVKNIPVYIDAIGPFGSTTSDTYRTAVTNKTNEILLMIICFSRTLLQENKATAISLFEKYGNAQNIIDVKVIKKDESNE